MGKMTKWMDRTFYPNLADNWDNTLFRDLIKKEIHSETRCLDYGSGRGNVKQMDFKGMAKFVAGIDPDKVVFQNPLLDEAKLLDLNNPRIPYDDQTFDVVFSNSVLEHVDEPRCVFQEISRVLKSGGVFFGKTPNKWHYVPLMAKLTPSWFHRFYNGLRGRKDSDTFPTVYRCNTRSEIIRYAAESGFEIEYIDCIEGRPEYLRLSSLTYLFGLCYERSVNSTEILSGLRCVWMFKFVKKA